LRLLVSFAGWQRLIRIGTYFRRNLWRRAIQRDAILGMSVAIATMAFIVFAKPIVAAYPSLTSTLAPFANIAWPWYVLIGTSLTLIVGILSSLTHPMPARQPVVS